MTRHKGPSLATGNSRYVDLHSHSTASDGTDPPARVVKAARDAGLIALALTDHDTVAGLSEASEAGQALGVRIIAGVELSAYEGDSESHLLGLHLTRLEVVSDRLSEFRAARRQRAQDMVKKLNAIGVRISFSDVLAVAADGALGRPHVARALVENGWARDLRDAFDRYLGLGRPAFLEKRRVLMPEAIQLVHDGGGLAILAHPGGDLSRERAASLQRVGLDGVEVLHPSHTAADRAHLSAIARDLGLVPSGGADSHGRSDAHRLVGALRVPEEWLIAQEARLSSGAAPSRVA